ncbi:MAG: hypothetical protein V9G23_12880 [Giesbergeria sp.]
MPMPRGMATYQPPQLPEPEELAGHGGAVRVLTELLHTLQADHSRRSGPAGLSWPD